MLSSRRDLLSPFAVYARVLMLLAATAPTALTAAGCGTTALDCSYLPSKCTVITLAALCPTGGACTVDAMPATCMQTSCTLESAQKLTIPLDGLKLTASTPDLLFRFNANIPVTDVHVLIDGKELPGMEDPGAAPYFFVKWADGAAAPKKIELSFTGSTGAVEVEVQFEDIECHPAELSACHSGGA